MDKLHISPDAYIECSWGKMYLVYAEHIHSDGEAEVSINKDMALKIIKYLKDAYDI